MYTVGGTTSHILLRDDKEEFCPRVRYTAATTHAMPLKGPFFNFNNADCLKLAELTTLQTLHVDHSFSINDSGVLARMP